VRDRLSVTDAQLCPRDEKKSPVTVGPLPTLQIRMQICGLTGESMQVCAVQRTA